MKLKQLGKKEQNIIFLLLKIKLNEILLFQVLKKYSQVLNQIIVQTLTCQVSSVKSVSKAFAIIYE
ncbi:hypothetical protein DERP_007584 [Dermatophagoides pteronyssinus]|uniref:Uncharacterized protein n=1 Tax=Dermatophagoides pteronyssinus TaxID=6956 RepID=A0ABQ8JK59_DERPT|nr:hypothetical protein DERP_007584 [Dermatophagoides pteronyssinus]